MNEPFEFINEQTAQPSDELVEGSPLALLNQRRKTLKREERLLRRILEISAQCLD